MKQPKDVRRVGFVKHHWILLDILLDQFHYIYLNVHSVSIEFSKFYMHAVLFCSPLWLLNAIHIQPSGASGGRTVAAAIAAAVVVSTAGRPSRSQGTVEMCASEWIYMKLQKPPWQTPREHLRSNLAQTSLLYMSENSKRPKPMAPHRCLRD